MPTGKINTWSVKLRDGPDGDELPGFVAIGQEVDVKVDDGSGWLLVVAEIDGNKRLGFVDGCYVLLEPEAPGAAVPVAPAGRDRVRRDPRGARGGPQARRSRFRAPGAMGAREQLRQADPAGQQQPVQGQGARRAGEGRSPDEASDRQDVHLCAGRFSRLQFACRGVRRSCPIDRRKPPIRRRAPGAAGRRCASSTRYPKSAARIRVTAPLCGS